MLTTEAEAKTKRCQEAISAQAPEAEVADALCCIGSACMAWRWGKRINVYEPVPEEEKAAKGIDFTIRQELGGYCGKAGKPVQIDMKDRP